MRNDHKTKTLCRAENYKRILHFKSNRSQMLHYAELESFQKISGQEIIIQVAFENIPWSENTIKQKQFFFF